MNPELLAVALVTGAATWAFRVLPTLARTDRLRPGGRLERFLAATGPAAIATLFVAAILPMVSPDPSALLPFAVGVLAVLGAWVATRSVALATLAGAVLHGLAVWGLS
jgi:branched-subunit amino acid transport protein